MKNKDDNSGLVFINYDMCSFKANIYVLAEDVKSGRVYGIEGDVCEQPAHRLKQCILNSLKGISERVEKFNPDVKNNVSIVAKVVVVGIISNYSKVHTSSVYYNVQPTIINSVAKKAYDDLVKKVESENFSIRIIDSEKP